MRRVFVPLLAIWLIVAIAAGLALLQDEPARGQVSWLASEQIAVATGDAETSASENSGQALNGHIYAIYLDFDDSITTTTDITITQIAPAMTVLQLTNTYTDTWYYPAVEYTDSAGAGLSAYAALPVMDEITISVGDTVTGTTIVTATLLWGE